MEPYEHAHTLDFYKDLVYFNKLYYESHRRLIELVATDLDCEEKIDMLVRKFLGNPIRFKKRKDPNVPKRARSAYIFYSIAVRKNPPPIFKDLKVPDIMREIGKMWNALPEDKKLPYEKLKDDDMERYQEEYEQYSIYKNQYYDDVKD